MVYQKTNWENSPSTKTPLNQTNLNKIEDGISNAVEKFTPSSSESAIETIDSIRSNNKSLQFKIGNTWYTAIHQPENGATYVPSVDAQGNISWTNTAGLSNPPTVNIRGSQGKSIRFLGNYSSNQIYVDNASYCDAVTYDGNLYLKTGSIQGTPGIGNNWSIAASRGDVGPRGLTGATPLISVGSVTSIPSNQPPKVSISGTNENPVISFEIPKGEQGIQGDPPKIAVGVVETLPEGSNAKATINGNLTVPLLNLGIPKGNTGAKGDKGVSLRYRGTYTPATQYVCNNEFVDLVTHNSSLYIKTDMTQGEPGVNDGWDLAAKKGLPPKIAATAKLLAAGQNPTVTVNNSETGATVNFGIPKGDRGETGLTPQLSVAAVNTLNPTDKATVVLGGTKENPTLTFGIPKGAIPALSVAQTNTLPAGSKATASITSGGALTFGIPKGDKGDKGDTGLTPKISIGTVSTLAPTENATVTLGGTKDVPVFDFGIPKGAIPKISVAATNTLAPSSKATASISADGALTFGIPKGDTGPQGIVGKTPNITMGTVSTLAAGAKATATITGSSEAPVLNLGIPKGEVPALSIGDTLTLEPGQNATASINGTVLTFGIPKGATGEKGNVGATPKIKIGTVSTLPNSSQATVTVGGTTAEPVLNFGLPRGETPALKVGNVSTLAAGSNATVAIREGSSGPLLDFGIPMGSQGNKGDTGTGIPSGGSYEQIITKNNSGAIVWGDIAPLMINDTLSSNLKTYSSTKIQSLIESPIVEFAIQPSEWINGVYTLKDSRITATSNQEILPPLYSADNKAIIEALQAANLMDAGQSSGQASIACAGTVPTIPVKIRVVFRGGK